MHNNLNYLLNSVLIGRGKEQLDISCVQCIYCEKLNPKKWQVIDLKYSYIYSSCTRSE